MSYLESSYLRLPPWLQNVGISLYGLRYRQERLGGNFKKYVAAFAERDHWSPELMREYQNSQLSPLLQHALQNVPYYRTKWKQAGIEPGDLQSITIDTLSRLPMLPKVDLRTDPESLVADNLRSGTRLHRYKSSGSSGTPVTCVCSSDGHRAFIASREVRSFGWAGTSIRARRSMLGGRRIVALGDVKPPFHRINLAEHQIYLSAFHISDKNAKYYVDALNRFKPEVLTGYANSHLSLARMIAAQNLKITFQPKALVLSSEKLTAQMKSILHQSFHARAFEEYGSVENAILGTECSEGSLHFHPDFGIAEIVDENGRAVEIGEDGKLLATGLLNWAQPLIRYEIGDRACMSTTPCACGRDHLPTVKEIVGRLEDVIISPDGRQTVRFHWLFIGLPNVLEGQIIQETISSIRVKVVPTKDYSEVDSKQIQARLRQHLGDVAVTVEPVPEIPRTERGKFRAVISYLSKKQ
jgi:phenylacetate-CoA ligase